MLLPLLQGVSIRAPARGRQSLSALSFMCTSFNPRPRTGATISRLKRSRSTRGFQSAPPHGGRPLLRPVVGSPVVFQSAPPHGGRLVSLRPIGVGVHVSIRAPARGATSVVTTPPVSTVFQSAPPHGGRRFHGPNRCVRNRFNPRPRTGGDQSDAMTAHDLIWFQSAPPHGGRPPRLGRRRRRGHVSIRAPARGATWRCQDSTLSSGGFNPRPRTGGDNYAGYVHYRLDVFQSAPPHGGRRSRNRRSRLKSRFNPRPRTGGDFAPTDSSGKYWWFQSAPPHGGRPFVASTSSLLRRFQSAPPHGGRQGRQSGQRQDHHVSIRAPARGATG